MTELEQAEELIKIIKAVHAEQNSSVHVLEIAVNTIQAEIKSGKQLLEKLIEEEQNK